MYYFSSIFLNIPKHITYTKYIAVLLLKKKQIEFLLKLLRSSFEHLFYNNLQVQIHVQCTMHNVQILYWFLIVLQKWTLAFVCIVHSTLWSPQPWFSRVPPSSLPPPTKGTSLVLIPRIPLLVHPPLPFLLFSRVPPSLPPPTAYRNILGSHPTNPSFSSPYSPFFAFFHGSLPPYPLPPSIHS
jgi:hypothetical protein